MKIKPLLFISALGFAISANALAGAGCCSMGMNAATSQEKSSDGIGPSVVSCKAMCEKLNLTEEQKAKVTEITASCPAEGCTPEVMEKCMKALGEVLTPEQMTQFRDECQKSCAAKCPAMKEEKME
ncbi:MAG: hypothetical protein V2A34_06985 [Lentisphaerota bacterium]